ncbi:MAG: 1,2-phenylacetyl-CoA epoxidase subunit B [Firmicutes bacterium]|nr:1,2-phenylacetyl-CoA epoxidase subunit B [Alicyclobacillaceae bacterium]MCL6496343.1 1,2-phenylacetyl-CoA epoxidase subunit B [Bacillota bacterium]
MDGERLTFDVYEVFAQTDPLGPHQHQFSLLASSPEMAMALAQENFLRRREIYSIWVVRRDQIVKSGPKERERFYRLKKSYRLTEDYRYLADKWRRYRQAPMTPETMV